MTDLNIKILSDITIFNKYAKYIPELGRRETWEELCERNSEMHIKKFPNLADEITEVYNKFVIPKKVLPSMRSFQFAGKPIELANNRIYNCCFVHVDDPRVFSEIMFLLLGGCFHEDTEIKTLNGNKKIKNVTIDDEVLTFNCETQEYYWIKPFCVLPTPTENVEKYQLTFDDGFTIKCTADHKFLTKARGWVAAKDLLEEDDLENINSYDKAISKLNITDIELYKEYKPVIDYVLGI